MVLYRYQKRTNMTTNETTPFQTMLRANVTRIRNLSDKEWDESDTLVTLHQEYRVYTHNLTSKSYVLFSVQEKLANKLFTTLLEDQRVYVSFIYPEGMLATNEFDYGNIPTHQDVLSELGIDIKQYTSDTLVTGVVVIHDWNDNKVGYTEKPEDILLEHIEYAGTDDWSDQTYVPS